jgi:hydrogenase maturation protein HypF
MTRGISAHLIDIMERRAIAIQGVVQGVGFRPFVYGLANRLNLGGFVKNRSGGVVIEVEGDPHALNSFLSVIGERAPRLARIDRITWERQSPLGDRGFRIESSDREAAAEIYFSPDIAACDDCLRELFDPADRRYHYPLLNCTNCGPRFTIVKAAPYDRANTTMAAFVMCAACQAEYEDPTNRRFHAQPTACPACGPKLRLVVADGRIADGEHPVVGFASAISQGKIGALKGVGGYHLVCDAANAEAVKSLRYRKHRDEKPFAIMVRDIDIARLICEVSPEEVALLSTPAGPIVLLRRLRAATVAAVAEDVAPGNPFLGVMLPYSPLHHLLADALGSTPLVMTSGNRSDEPIAYEDEDALDRLKGIADVFLVHNRPIHVRCEDSVTRIVAGRELPVRRSRGYAPAPLALPMTCPWPILATGGQLKATFALGRDRLAFVSHHLGDLDDYRTFRQFENDVALYERLFEIEPRQLAHDLHPDYASTHYARERVRRHPAGSNHAVRLVPVQHHHAHIASCMAENGLAEPVIGVSFDGTGYGTDGTIWGGEFLVGDYLGFRRAAHLRSVGMPGADQAIREPWRMATAHLRDAGIASGVLAKQIDRAAVRTVEQMLDRGINTPMTSSAGRLFDAVGALAGLRLRTSYEGQAAMELEWRANDVPDDGSYPFGIAEVSPSGAAQSTLQIDTRPLVREVVADAASGESPGVISRRFHNALVEMVATVCERIRASSGLNAVVLSGGVFLNSLLTTKAIARLAHEGFRVYRHRLVPPNDGGLAFGQLAIAAALARASVAGEHAQGVDHVLGNSRKSHGNLPRA